MNEIKKEGLCVANLLMLRLLLLPDASLVAVDFINRQRVALVRVWVCPSLLDELLQVTLSQLLVQPIDHPQSVLENIRGITDYEEERFLQSYLNTDMHAAGKRDGGREGLPRWVGGVSEGTLGKLQHGGFLCFIRIIWGLS